MTFQKCSIGNAIYGHSLAFKDVWHDSNLKKMLKAKDETVLDFFRCLALNHTAAPSSNPLESTGLYEYASASPDEEALCAAAAFFGVVLSKRTTFELTLLIGARFAKYSHAALGKTCSFSKQNHGHSCPQAMKK